MVPFLDLKAQYRSIRSEVGPAIERAVEGCQFVLGEEVEAFEREFAAYCGVRHAMGVNSGTSALHVALLAAGVRPGDEVITASFTFVATAAAIRYAGAVPVFVDVSRQSRTLDVERIEAAITPRTRAILPVHLYGQCADMDPILEIARRHALAVIEDAAQAHGAIYKGQRAGSMGDLGCFSFYPGKNLGAYGEGGAVVTNNADSAQAIRVLRDHGQSGKYNHVVLGFNYRLEGVQGAVLRVKLRHLDDWNAARSRHALAYRRRLDGAGVTLLDELPYGTSVHHLFPVFTPERDALQAHLNAAGIGNGLHYPVPVHLQPAFADLGYRKGDLPVSEQSAAETLSLPMYPELTAAGIEAAATAVEQFTRATSVYEAR
jgi:dTDP-4-amino-4,6-dideoxygalactose transaminase